MAAKVPIEKDGMYHFAAIEQGQSVRLSEDYFIEARQDQAPTVHIVRPRGDAKVSPIEEVTIGVDAADDFALDGMELHYSVNGAPEKTVSLLAAKGVKQASGKTMISLEDYKLQAGDVVSVYATARDARNTARTDIVFIETQPFEKNYTPIAAGWRRRRMAGSGTDQNRDLPAPEGNHRGDLECDSRRRQGQSQFRRERPVPVGNPSEAERTSSVPGATRHAAASWREPIRNFRRS